MTEPTALVLENPTTEDAMWSKIRPAVAEFAIAMEAKLRKNDHKTGWQQLPVEALRRLMMLEIEEYNVAREFFGAAEAMNELVDIANFAMMLRDRYRIEEEKSREQPVSA